MKPITPIKPHPFAEMLPLMNEKEFASLKEDVISKGRFVEPAKTYQGMLLDGRNRQRVAIETGIPLPTQEFKGSDADAVRHVYSRANRRNLDESQKACAAVNFLPHFEAEAKVRMAQGVAQHATASSRKLFNGKTRPEMQKELRRMGKKKLEHTFRFHTAWMTNVIDLSPAEQINRILQKMYGDEQAAPPAPVAGKSRDFAGSLFGVSGRYVQDAKALREADPKLFQTVFEGKLKLSQATTELRRKAKHSATEKKHAALPAQGDTKGIFEIKVGDNLKVMPTMARQWAKLIVADPQYNIGIDYGDGKKGDVLKPREYLDRSWQWLNECVELLKPDGSIWIVINDEWAAEYCLMLKGLKLHRRAWVKWYETFGVNCANNFNRTSRHLLYFTKSPSDFVFNPAAVMRKSDRQTKYADIRANPAGKIWDDVWQIPRLVDNAAERVPGFPTQLPLALIKPIVACCTDPGDWVLDPFNGSGTTGEACIQLHRPYVGIEVNPKFAALSERRLRIALAERKH